MNRISKAMALTALVSMVSACAVTTAPRNATYWYTPDSGYQTHKERIKIHDHQTACNNASKQIVKSQDLPKAERKQAVTALADKCMTAEGYQKVDNWHPIKQTAK